MLESYLPCSHTTLQWPTSTLVVQEQVKYLHEAFRVVEFPVGVDDLGLGLEAVVAASAAHAIHVHDAGDGKSMDQVSCSGHFQQCLSLRVH